MSHEQVESAASVPGRVWTGTRWLVLGRLYGSLCTLISLWWIARHLDDAAFGRYSFYLALFLVLDTWCDFGTGQYCVQQSASGEQPLSGLLQSARRLRLGLGMLGSMAITGLAWSFGESGIGWIWLASLYPLTHALELSTVPLRNRIDWRRPVMIRMSAASLSLVFVLVLGLRGVEEPAIYLLGVAAGSTIGNFLLHWACRSAQPRDASAAPGVLALLREVWPLGLASLCQQAYFHIDAVFVRAICGPEELGPYHIAVRVMSYTIMVAIFATQAAQPWLARAHAAGELGRATTELAQRLFTRACALIGLVLPWGWELLEAFRPGFGRAHASLCWLLLAATLVYAGASLMTALVAAGRRRSILHVAIVALAINVSLNLLLIPGLGITGAGFVTFLTEGSVVIMGAWSLASAREPGAVTSRMHAWLAGPLLLAAAALCSYGLRWMFYAATT